MTRGATGRVARRPVVGVMGSGSAASGERALPLGRWLAEAGVHLLTGGGAGAMAAVARAFVETPGRKGLSVGVLPASQDHPTAPPPGYPNPWVELVVRTHLPLRGERGAEPLSRNHVNVLSADVVVALPGGAGTASEVALALRYGRPVVGFLASRDELPGAPPELPVEPALEGIAAFVRARLAGR